MSVSAFSTLLVDDDPHVCEVFKLVMAHHQLPLEILNDAESALSYLAVHHPDVIVMDIFLPGLDGYQALNRIRGASLAPNSKVIATTAYYTNDTEQEIMNRGFDGYIPKPFDSNKLVQYLQGVAAKDS